MVAVWADSFIYRILILSDQFPVHYDKLLAFKRAIVDEIDKYNQK